MQIIRVGKRSALSSAGFAEAERASRGINGDYFLGILYETIKAPNFLCLIIRGIARVQGSAGCSQESSGGGGSFVCTFAMGWSLVIGAENGQGGSPGREALGPKEFSSVLNFSHH